jgi:hypothetical protein
MRQEALIPLALCEWMLDTLPEPRFDLTDEKPSVRCFALQAISAFEADGAPAQAAVKRATRDPDVAVRVEAELALQSIRP